MTDVDVEVVERAQAKWDRLGVKWRNEFLLVPSDPSQGSWLQVQGKPWGVGCQACAGHATSFATFNVRTEAGLQRSNFKSHAANKHHQAAVAQTVAGKYQRGSLLQKLSLNIFSKISETDRPLALIERVPK